MHQTKEETIIQIPETNRFFAIEPSLEELTQNPTNFNIALHENNTDEAIGTYKFRPPIKTPTKATYKAAKIMSNKQRTGVPRDLINAANYALNQIAKTQRTQKPSFEVIHKCNFYLMQNDAFKDSNLTKYNEIMNMYKQKNYEFENNAEATKKY